MTGTPAPVSPVAHLEDILPAGPMDQLTYEELCVLHAQIGELTARMDTLKDALRDSMSSRGAQALVDTSGKVIARISEVNTPRIDTATLKREHPELAKKLMIVTKTTRFQVTWPKEEPVAS